VSGLPNQASFTNACNNLVAPSPSWMRSTRAARNAFLAEVFGTLTE
jgi:hypothetical protein